MIICVLCLLLLKGIESKIVLDIKTDVNNRNNVYINYTGIEVDLVTENEVKLFKITSDNLADAVKNHYGRRPTSVYLASPTPWGDLYKIHKWEQVSRVLSIKSATLKSISKNPVIVTTQDFENFSNGTIKVNTGISHAVENSITTTWSKDKEFTVTQEIEYDVNMIFEKLSGTTGFSYTSIWGCSEEKTKTVTIGSTSAVETELKPGQAVTAILTANAGYLEIEVIHKASLRGNVAVNFKKALNGHHFWGPPIENVMRSGGIGNELTTTEIIKFGFHVDASLKLYDKITKEPL